MSTSKENQPGLAVNVSVTQSGGGEGKQSVMVTQSGNAVHCIAGAKKVTAVPTVFAHPITASLVASMIKNLNSVPYPLKASSVVQAAQTAAKNPSSSRERASVQKGNILTESSIVPGTSKSVNLNVRLIKPTSMKPMCYEILVSTTSYLLVV